MNKFAEMARRTRFEYLVELCNKHSTNQTVHHVDSASSSMNSLNSFKKLFGSVSSSSSGASCGDVHTSKRSKHFSANHEFHLIQQDAYLIGGSLAPFSGPPLPKSHILYGHKGDPPTLLGGILFNERCAGSSVPSKLYVHDFSTSRDIEVSLLLSNEAIMAIDAGSSEVIWAAPVTSIIGWTDSSGVFATSPTTSPTGNDKQINGSSHHRAGPSRAKAVDCEPVSPVASQSASCRELRLYYHQGECIQIMQRPTGVSVNSLPTIPEPSPSTTSKSGRNGHNQIVTNSRNDDPFLHLIRILELVTRKSELREIVIKRKTSPVHKPQQQQNGLTNSTTSNPNNLSLDLPGRCGGQFGFSMSLSSGIVEKVMDQTLSSYRLEPGFKVLEIAKISFAVMAPEELQDLINASVLICLTYTDYDFVQYQPRCACLWPQAQQLQRQKSQLTPPSEYENLPLSSKMPLSSNTQSANTTKSSSISTNGTPTKSQLSNGTITNASFGQPGVKSIHITHNPSSSLPQSTDEPSNQSSTQSSQPQHHHQALMNVSSTSSTSSYYSTNNSNSQNQSPSHSLYGTASLYQAKSASNLSQYNSSNQHGYASHQSSPTKSVTSSALSSTNNATTNGGASVVRSKSSTINAGNGNTSFKGKKLLNC